MSFIAAAVIAGGAALGGAAISAYGANQAASKQVSAEQAAIATQQQYEQPFVNASTTVLPTLEQLLTPGPNQTQALSQIPGYQFLLSQGLQGVNATGTTRGLGGNVQAAAANYATGTAQNAFGSIVNPLMQIYQQGASSANSAANAISSAQVGIGNAGAGAASTTANAASGALGSIGNLALLRSLISGNPNSNSSWATPPANSNVAAQPVNYTQSQNLFMQPQQ
jgi:hypothetical protein